jgi:phage-related protein
MRGGMRASSFGACNRASIRTSGNRCPRSGPGVRDIRIHTGLEHRVFYVAAFAEAVYVLHAFEKRTRKTPKHDLELAQDRLRGLVNRRRTDAGKK